MRSFQGKARRLLAVTLALGAFGANYSANAQDDAEMHATRMTYDAALKCFVADGYASDERRKSGDSEKSAVYRAKARVSFDLAYTAGEKIGLGDDMVGRDIDFALKTELPRFVQDQRYLLDTASTCKALGLM